MPATSLAVRGLSEQDRLRVELRDMDDNVLLPVQSGNGRIDVSLAGLGLQAGTQYRLHVFSDRTPTVYDVALAFVSTPDLAESNDTIDTAFRLEAPPADRAGHRAAPAIAHRPGLVRLHAAG